MKVWHAGELVQTGGGGDNSQECDDGVSRGPASGCAAAGCGCPQPQDQVQCSGMLPATHALDRQKTSTCCKSITAYALPACETDPLLCCAMLCCVVHSFVCLDKALAKAKFAL